MKSYRKTVFVSDKDVAANYVVAKVQAAVGVKTGPLNVVTRIAVDVDQKPLGGWYFTGDAVAFEQSDSDNPAAVDAKLAADLGAIGRVADDDPVASDYKAGMPIDHVYVLNHGGLPLAYGDAIKSTFAKRGGRIDVTSALAAYSKAVAWAAVANPSLLAAVGTPEGQKALVDAYAAGNVSPNV